MHDYPDTPGIKLAIKSQSSFTCINNDKYYVFLKILNAFVIAIF